MEVKAKFACDRCGQHFVVGVEYARAVPSGWSVFEVAEDAIRGGLDYEDQRNEPGAIGSVDRMRHLCSRCTIYLYGKAGS